jgi:hypothetical protein
MRAGHNKPTREIAIKSMASNNAQSCDDLCDDPRDQKSSQVITGVIAGLSEADHSKINGKAG